MPDISMCSGMQCPQKEKCYLYRAIPSERQAYFTYPPYEGEECEYFQSFDDKRRVRPVNEICVSSSMVEQ